MMRRPRNPMSWPVAAALPLLFASPAHGEDSAGSPRSEQPEASQTGYGYRFQDDPLHSGAFGPKDHRIRVRKDAVRMGLLRPRTSFVTEMLKSARQM